MYPLINNWSQVSPNFAGEDKTAILIRVHHVLGDGLALVSFLGEGFCH